MGASSTLAILILIGSFSTSHGFMFSNSACGCPPPPPPPPKCDCACAQAPAQQQYAPQAAQYAPMYAAPVYYAPAAQQQAAYVPATAARSQSASEAYDAAIDNAVLDTIGGQVAGGSQTAGYQAQSRGAYATGPASQQQQQQYPSTADLNGFPSGQQSAYAQPGAQSSAVYGGQQAQSYFFEPQAQTISQQSAYAQPAQQQSSAVYGQQQTQATYVHQAPSRAVYGQQQEAYGQHGGYAQPSAAAAAGYTLSIPPSQAQQQYVVADTAALSAFSQAIASQPLPGLAASQAAYARPSAAVSSGLPASTIQYATVPAGVAVDQHLALQIANEAATYVSANNDGNQYVQTKQNAFARQHNPAVNEYARVGGVEGGSAAREQYLTRPEPIPATVTYVNANTYTHRKPPVVVLPVIERYSTPSAPTRVQFTAPSDIEILAAEQSDPMILASAVAHDAPPLSAAPAHTVIETVDTTSLVLPTNDIIAASDAAEVSESVRHLDIMNAPEFEQALQTAAQVPEEEQHAPVAVKASVSEEPRQHSVVAGESEFQGSPLTEENLLEGNVADNEVEHNTDPEQPDQEESETLTDIHLQEGISIKTRVHAAPTARVPHRDFGLARH